MDWAKGSYVLDVGAHWRHLSNAMGRTKFGPGLGSLWPLPSNLYGCCEPACRSISVVRGNFIQKLHLLSGYTDTHTGPIALSGPLY